MANSLKELKAFIGKAVDALPNKTDTEKSNIQFFKQAVTSLEAAEALLADKNALYKEEKEARAIDAATKWVNQLAFILYRNNLMTEELEKDYRKFDGFEITTAEAKKYYDERENSKQEHISAMQQLAEIDQDIDVFMAVLSGKSKKEAKELVKKFAESGVSADGVAKG
jgi:hypothetical protein